MEEDTKQDEPSMFDTILISDQTLATRSVEDTVNSTAKTTADWLAELELGKVKKAGTFLDGCKIFLSGFTEAEQVLSRFV